LLAFGLGAVVLMPIAGWLCGRVGSRATTLTSAFLFTLMLLLPGLAPDLASFVAASLIAGACNGATDVSMNTNATEVESAWKAPIMSSFHAFFSLGGLVGAGASGLLIAAGYDIPATLAISCAAIGLMLVGASFGLLPHTPKAAEGAAEGHAFAWPRGPMVGLAVLTLLCFLLEGAMVDWTAIYLRTVAGAPLEIAVAGFAAFSLTMTICRFLGDIVVHRLGRVRTVMAGGSIAALGLALALAVPQPALATLGFALVGLGLANVVPILFSVAGQAKGIPPGIGIAMVATLGYAGLLLGPPVIGFIGDLIGLRETMSLLIVGALVVVALARRVLRAFACPPTPSSP
jgi:MFS family permease